MHSFRYSFAGLLLLLDVVAASVTIYYQQGQSPLGASGTSAPAANYTGAAAYNPTVLDPPPVPSPAIPTSFTIQLQTGGTPGVSIPQQGSFFGFSVEFSVTNQVLGKNSSFLQVPFLNLMANIQQRAGRVNVRLGGNTQETASLVESLSDGKILEKDLTGVTNPTQTPPLVFTPDLIYMMSNISALVNVKWYLGVPFNDSSNWRLQIAEVGQAILGDNLIGLQAGNEPDLYAQHNHRPDSYSPTDYFNEFGSLITAMQNDPLVLNKSQLIGPSIASANWSPEMVWDTGFIDAYSSSLATLAVEHYPTDNCFAQFGIGIPRTGQEMFPQFLNHTSGTSLVQPYLNSTAFVASKGKTLIMFETNTASCGGFAGLSDSFGAALWALDFGMQMAYANFSGALLHIGGQSVFYNPFTPPPTNQSTFHQWTIGPVYYSALIMAEALGPSNQSQILDMQANGDNQFTPAYTIYEGGNPVRVALFNYITDSSGASDYTATIAVGGGQTGQANATPAQVKVKYFAATSVSQKGNFTWAGQTFGGNFESDGRPTGTEDVQTVQCDTTAGTCGIKVPAPGFALVFLSDAAMTETAAAATETFPTTALTKTLNTATIDAAVLATSNGHSGMGGVLGSTSKGSTSGARAKAVGLGGVGVLLAVGAAGALLVGNALVR